MKIILLCVGRTRRKDIAEAIETYASRIPHYIPFRIECIPDIKTTQAMTQESQKTLEGEKILAQLQTGDFLMLLDERGKEYTSREFASWLEKKNIELPGRLVLAIGGPYGFSKDVYARAGAMLSLSRMTFPHELVRLFIVEQLYRAMTILRGEPYHHD
ncbi:MAG: 23S rRNA (pseudouridine(1915)-N(3))-methyltransferase RlmH [Muribaculaceae bacterium]|nr:23S rRNA (pseudouridine(1915)-N(3))-methyltransferase RlmH [Muribaculaceae bacterium]